MTMEAERERLEDPTVNFEDGESGQEPRVHRWYLESRKCEETESPLQCLGGGATLPGTSEVESVREYMCIV